MVFDQSYPQPPHFRIQGSSLSVMKDGEGEGGEQKFLCLILYFYIVKRHLQINFNTETSFHNKWCLTKTWNNWAWVHSKEPQAVLILAQGQAYLITGKQCDCLCHCLVICGIYIFGGGGGFLFWFIVLMYWYLYLGDGNIWKSIT